VKIKKSVTEKVIAANRANAKKSTGPQNTRTVRKNAVKHRLLAKRPILQNEQDEAEFSKLLAELDEDYRPSGRTEQALVEEVAMCLWKLQMLNGWEMEEISTRRKATRAILRAVAENYDNEQLPLFTKEDGSRSAALLGWDCQELLVRSDTMNSEQEDHRSSGDREVKSGRVQIEAKLTTSLETILRYQSAIKQDLYRAIAALREMRRSQD
jgi:hypothetical protein